MRRVCSSRLWGELFVIASRLLTWYWISLLLYPDLSPEFRGFTLRRHKRYCEAKRFIWYQNFPSALEPSWKAPEEETAPIVTGLFHCLLEFVVERLGVRAMLVNQQMSGSLSRKGSFLAQNARFCKEHLEGEQYPCELPLSAEYFTTRLGRSKAPCPGCYLRAQMNVRECSKNYLP